jgi:hypothetical protein
MVVLVVVSLQKMSISRQVVFLVIVRSRKLICPAFSGVGLSCRLLCWRITVLHWDWCMKSRRL